MFCFLETDEPAHNLSFERLCLCRRHLLGGKVKNFFAQQLENDHVVFAYGQIGLRGRHDLGDERGPVVRPVRRLIQPTVVMDQLATAPTIPA